MYCKLKQAEWTKLHKENDSCECGGANWTIEGLQEVVLQQLQKDADKVSYESQGVKDHPSWLFIPISRVLFPILHEVLGLVNDLFGRFQDYVKE